MSRSDARWDLVVVGAGPAGAATALGALRRRPALRVLLLDRADFPRDKSCGDGIAPHVRRRPAPRSAPRDVVDGWTPLRTSSSAAATASGRRRDGRGRSWVVPRAVFDARLVERAVARGRRAAPPPGRAQVDAGDGGVVLDGGTGAGSLVGADGAHSVVRAARSARPRRAAGRWRSAATRPTPPDRRGRAGDRVRRPPPAVVRLGLRPRRRAVQRRVRRAAPATARPRRRRGAAARRSSSSCCPARPPTGDATGAATTCRCPAGAGSSPTARCCWPATPPGWSTR